MSRKLLVNNVKSDGLLLYLNSNSLTQTSTIWIDLSGNNINFTLSQGTPNVDENGLLMTSCKVVGNSPITLSGAFSYNIKIYFNENGGYMNTWLSLNKSNLTKYCDSISNTIKLNGYSGDTITSISISKDILYDITIVRPSVGNTQLYVNKELKGSYSRGTFDANGDFDLVLGASSWDDFPIKDAYFRIKELKIFNKELTLDEINDL